MPTDRSDRGRLAASYLALILAWGGLGLAQAPSRDKDLDDLLKKADEAAKPKEKARADEPPKPGEVAPKDKDLDSLLQKLGESKDDPNAEGKATPPPAGEGDDKKPPEGGGGDGKDKKPPGEADDKKPSSRPRGSGLTGKDEELERHLSGEDKKQQQQKKKQQGQGEDEEKGPLGDLVKQMREVEKRLGQPDTGESTRQKQGEIVKKMDGMIAQMRLVRGPSAMRQMRNGKQPGQQKGDQSGRMAEGPPATRPATPNGKSVVALDKTVWGHLPPEARQEMENVFKEDYLPAKKDLIDRYYISVNKKSLTRGD